MARTREALTEEGICEPEIGVLYQRYKTASGLTIEMLSTVGHRTHWLAQALEEVRRGADIKATDITGV